MLHLLIILTVTVVPSVFAAVSLQYATDTNQPGKCVSMEEGLVLPDGGTQTLPGCKRAVCTNLWGHMYLEWALCGKEEIPTPPCMTRTDVDLPYPYCCPKTVCPPPHLWNNNNNNNNNNRF
ncbi:hypothetical protein Pmani_014231 [Petrolisthes manimaculis]|uniref:Single domain-containing protein n=1 Tax=Petrolisthes manimaculis TaxID=1843537 RepID=A0AAE1UBB5_9EUCA|nr:hypothetical protein Pmani_014231 [Petrolisthes manimaculis]